MVRTTGIACAKYSMNKVINNISKVVLKTKIQNNRLISDSINMVRVRKLNISPGRNPSMNI